MVKNKILTNPKSQITYLNLKDLFEILLKFSKVLKSSSVLFVILDIGICLVLRSRATSQSSNVIFSSARLRVAFRFVWFRHLLYSYLFPSYGDTVEFSFIPEESLSFVAAFDTRSRGKYSFIA